MTDRRPSSRGPLSVRWSGLPDGAVGLCIADADLPSHPGVQRVLRSQAQLAVHGYARVDPAAGPAVARWYAQQHGWAVDPQQVTTLPVGIKTAVRLVLEAIGATKPLLLTPVYSGLLKVANARAGAAEVALRVTDGRWAPDRRATEAAILELRPDAVILCNPQNPVGTAWSSAELRWLTDVAARVDATVICDEAHSDLVHVGARHVPLGAAAGPDARWVVVHSLGKAFNVSGIPYCWTVTATPELQKSIIDEASRWGLHPGSAIGDALVVELLLGGDDWLRARRQQLFEHLRLAHSWLNDAAPALHCDMPEAGYLLWIRVPSDLGDPSSTLLEHAGVRVLPGPRFGTGWDQYVRLNVATAAEVLERAVRDITGVVAERLYAR